MRCNVTIVSILFCVLTLTAGCGGTSAPEGKGETLSADSSAPEGKPDMKKEAVSMKATAVKSELKYPWQKPQAKVLPTGDLQWAPKEFVFEKGNSPRYIDFESGNDGNAGTAKESSWKHHPWDPDASGNAKACSGIHTYIFKGGVAYRGMLKVKESGTKDNPIRITRDPSWGEGEALIYGSEIVTGLVSGKAPANCPAKDKVVSADLDYAPRNVWLIKDPSKFGGKSDEVIRLPLARTPNWTVTNYDDIKSEWWVWNNPGKHQDLRMKVGGAEYNACIDTVHLTEKPEYYKDALVWTEWGYVMGTPYPTRVEGFDPKQRMMAFRSPWGGRVGERFIRNNRYYLEDKPEFLDDPKGEFWFEKKGNGGTIHVIIPEGMKPSDVRIEAGKRSDLILANTMSNIVISGIGFRFTNTYWDITATPSGRNRDVDNASVKLLGSGEHITVKNCSFYHVNKAVYFKAPEDDDMITEIVFNDNDVKYCDHYAVRLLEGHQWGEGSKTKFGQIGNAEILRNRLQYVGMRPTRQGQGHAIEVTYADLLHVAGNILDRCWASGIFIWGGSEGTVDAPLCRMITHHNKVTNSLLNTNDWGQIETWHGGPSYVYDNISGNPGGYWNYNFKGGWSKEHANARFGHAFYQDHGNNNYLFNNIAWGNPMGDDLKSPLGNASAFQEIGTQQNSYFNNTAYKFVVGHRRQGPKEGFNKYMGNIYSNIGLRVWRHSDPKMAATAANAHHVGDPGKDFAYHTNAYLNNIFNKINQVGVFESNGASYKEIKGFIEGLVRQNALATDAAVMAESDPLPNAAEHDFRPTAEVKGKGAKVYVPWGLYMSVGEWNFYREKLNGTVLDEHWANTRYDKRHQRFPLTPVNITETDFVKGELENWTNGAVSLNGENQYLTVADKDVNKTLKWTATNRRTRKKTNFTAEGKTYYSPAVYDSNFLIETYLKAEKPEKEAVIMEKMGESGGYSLKITEHGAALFTVKADGTEYSARGVTDLTDGSWHHLLVQCDRKAERLMVYVDGKDDSVKLGLPVVSKGPGPVSINNSSGVYVGGTPNGRCLKGTIDMLRISLGTLADAETTIDELYTWQFNGPFLYDFAGKPRSGSISAGALECTE